MILWWLMVSKHCLCCRSWGIGLSNRIIFKISIHVKRSCQQNATEPEMYPVRDVGFLTLERKMETFCENGFHPLRSCISQIFGTFWSAGRDSTGKSLLTRESTCSASPVQCRSPFNPNLHGLNSAWLIFSCTKDVTAFRIFLPLNYEAHSVGV